MLLAILIALLARPTAPKPVAAAPVKAAAPKAAEKAGKAQ